MRNTAIDNLFFFFFFLSSAYITEVKWSISKKSIIFQGSRGGLTFSRGGGGTNFFQGASYIESKKESSK